MNITRRTAFKGLLAAGALPLFNIGCANFGMSRARQIAKGAKIRVALIGCGLQTKFLGTHPAERAIYSAFRDVNPLNDLGIG